MKPSEILKYYLNDEIMNRLLNVKGRECAARYGESFGKRPMYFQYKGDLEILIKSGATSFHVSEERWSNPLSLSKDMNKEQLASLRNGWDLLLDIDCKDVGVSKVFSKIILDRLRMEGVKSTSIKFSGGSGFHILMPYETFPESINGKEINMTFPDAPMIISIYLKNELRELLSQTLMKDYGIKKLAGMFKLDEDKIAKHGFDPYEIINIDTVLISERHMFRMQYSLNEKKWLASTPLEKEKLDEFDIEMAKPENVDPRLDFFNLKPAKGEAEGLFVRAYDKFEPEPAKEEKAFNFEIKNVPLNADYLPPCIKIILNGLSDGKKRSVFILTNFFRNIGKTKEEVVSLLLEWNKKNTPPLKEGLIKSQVDYIFAGKPYPPPNCDAQGYYKYFNVCFPNETCRKIKNPLSYYLLMDSAHRKKPHSKSSK
ncbi:MAG: hypothetical protein M1441_01995 [Candidatus Parvarchaeota archaeon]|jgi:hypothetical protein|nr:hypothetical protein [Candidatus Parvarchaeota archaeon]